jgi:sugar lactone lactonase YvrE
MPLQQLAAERLTGPVAYHAEGPCWDAAAGDLLWVDMLAGDLLSLPAAAVTGPAPVADAAVRRRHLADVLACVRPRRAGGLVLAVQRGFALLDAGAETPRVLPPLWEEESMRMNEGGCDAGGAFHSGSLAPQEGQASLYRLDPDGTPSRVLGGVTISNGLAWTPDGRRAYYADTPTGWVDVFDADPLEGTLTGRRPFVEIDPDDGVPDGLTLDAEGHVWVALHGGGQVRRYAPDGSLAAVVTVPEHQTTACAFAGPDLDVLVVTTSAENLDRGEHPTAGSLYRVRPGVRGVPPHLFAG